MPQAPSSNGAASIAGSAAGSFGPVGSVSPSVVHIDPDLRKCLSEVDALLAIHVAAWMKKRGRVSAVHAHAHLPRRQGAGFWPKVLLLK